MKSALMSDAVARPDLFQWNGPMDPIRLQDWLANHAWLGACPLDLQVLWQETGGGDLFESETVLGPMGNPDLGDDIAGVNRAMRARGMSVIFIVYHVGISLSAVDSIRGDYVELDDCDFHVVRRFSTLEEWYLVVIRSEYKERYGLR